MAPVYKSKQLQSLLIVVTFSLGNRLHADQPVDTQKQDTIDQAYNEFIPNFVKLSQDEQLPFQTNDTNQKNIPTQPVKEKTFEDYFNEGNELLRANNIDGAIACYKKSLELNPVCPQTHFNLGVAQENKENTEEAITAFQRAILYKPAYAKAHMQLAKVLEKKKLTDQALHHYQKAIEHDEQLADAQLATARILSDKEQFKQASTHFRKALELQPNGRATKFELANCLNTINETEEALDLYFELLAQKPDDTAVTYNIAYTLKKLNRLEEAMPFYKSTLERKPDHSEAHFSLGLAYLVTGNFEKGWKEYEWRWQRKHQLTPRDFKEPQWDGSDLQGKTILLHAEQGLGDTLQFIRYAQLAKQKNGTVIVAVQKPLVTLLSSCPYVDKVVQLRSEYPHFDIQAPLMSLPYILKTRLETVPADIPYIYADPVLVEQWREKLSEDKNFKIGICWQGNSNYSTPFLRAVVAAKSMQLTTLTPLFNVPGVSIYNLQKETGIDQLKSLPKNCTLHSFDDDFDQSNGRFMDTAAVIKNLDLVVTIDTSISHLAGALGVPVWNLLPNPPDWRWLLNRSDTPWYPNMRLFRQPKPGDWQSVVATVIEELSAFVSGKPLPKRTITLEEKKEETEQPQAKQPQQQSSLCTELNEELHAINNRIDEFSRRIRMMQHTNPSDPELLKHMRSFYVLTELRKTVQEKIDELIDATTQGAAAA